VPGRDREHEEIGIGIAVQDQVVAAGADDRHVLVERTGQAAPQVVGK